MRRASLLVFCLALVAVANDATYAARRPLEKIICSAIADCGEYTDVSCASDVNGTTCQAVDRDCSIGQRGYVRCGSSYTYCPVCPICTEGTYRWVTSRACCEDGSRMKKILQERCSGGRWVSTGAWTCGGKCEPLLN